MKFEVNKDACISCGACMATCPDVFKINDDGIAEADNTKLNETNIEDAKDAMDGCPTGAISCDNN